MEQLRRQRRADIGRAAQAARIAAVRGWGQEGDGDDARGMRRDEFLLLTGAALGSLIGPPLVHGWPDRSAAELPALSAPLLAQLRAQNEGFRWLDRQQGAFGLLPATAGHARSLANFWRVSADADPLRLELAEVAADACHLVAYQAFDQGKRTEAIEWYKCSAELAAQARVQDLYVFAICGVAYMHARNGDGELALSVLRELTCLSLSMAAQCYVAVYQAHAYASARSKDPALVALDRAATLSSRAAQEVPSSWLGITDRAFVERQRAMILADLSPADAVSVLEQLARQTPAVFQRYRLTLLASQAMAHTRLGDVEHAAELLRAAFERNQVIRSVEKANRLRAVRTALAPYADSGAVTATDEIIRAPSGDQLPPGAAATGP